MIAIGFAVVWLGYTAGIWGYCLVRDYNVPFASLLKATWPNVAAAGTGQGTPTAPAQPTPTGQLTQAQQLTGQ